MVATIRDRGVVRIGGADAAAYLQGQVSQDVDALPPGDVAWSLVLDPTGKFVAAFRLHRLAGDEFLLDTEPVSVEPLVTRLQRFRLRSAVTIEEERGWRMLSVRGDERVDDDRPADAVRVPVAWPGFAGTDVLGPVLALPAGLEVDDDAYEAARIAAGVPRSGVDLDADTIPAEGGSALIEAAVSFTKGCYTGQELVARIDSRGGNVPRPLRVLRAEASLGVGDDVLADGAVVGAVTSAADRVGLARVLRKVEPGTAVQVGGVPAVVEAIGSG